MTSIVFAQVIGPCAYSEHAWSSKEDLMVWSDNITGGEESNELEYVSAVFILGPELSPWADCSVLSEVSWLSGYFMHSLCFLIPAITFPVSADILVVSAV